MPGAHVREARERAAVVGSGIAGLTAAHVLQRRFDVTLFEADDRLGGHAHTHEVDSPDAGLLRVDTGFIVHNRVTYPNLVRLFGELGVETQRTEMSMSVRCDGCGLEYCGAKGPGGVFAQPSSLGRPSFLRMLGEVVRFHRRAAHLLRDPDDLVTLGDFLDDGGFTDFFRSHFVVPVVAAVWSTAPRTALDYPAFYLFAFLANHGMLSVRGSHQWYTVTGGSRAYVDAIAKGLTDVRVSSPVDSIVRPHGGSVQVRSAGAVERFDRVVIATHPDAALRMLDHPEQAEREVLAALPYSVNEAQLHQDVSVLPRATRARAAWNYYMPSCEASADSVAVSYDMNLLQRLPTRYPYIVTLNGADRVDPARVLDRMRYEHPVYTHESMAAQHRLTGLGNQSLQFAGAYHGWGFHEDGCRSGATAAAKLGVAW